jgi:hypothetical protein
MLALIVLGTRLGGEVEMRLDHIFDVNEPRAAEGVITS